MSEVGTPEVWRDPEWRLREQAHEDRLDALVNTYTGRRTIQATFVRAVVDLHLADRQQRAALFEAVLTAEREEHQRALDQVLRRSEDKVAGVMAERDRLQQQVEAHEARQTNLRELREEDDEGVICRFPAPTIRGNAHRPWTLGEIDALSYRARLAGGTDHTEVKVEYNETRIRLPMPEYAFAPTADEAEPAPPTSRLCVVAVPKAAVVVMVVAMLVAALVVALT